MFIVSQIYNNCFKIDSSKYVRTKKFSIGAFTSRKSSKSYQCSHTYIKQSYFAQATDVWNKLLSVVATLDSVAECENVNYKK